MDERKSSEAMMGIPSKPKFVLSSPSISRRQSHGALRTKKDKHGSESHLRDSPHGNSLHSPTKQKKNKSGLNSVLHNISEFNHHANAHYNIKYQDFEKSMSDMSDKFQTQIEQFQAARANAEQMIASFEQQVKATHETYDTELKQSREWQAPAEKIEHMQERVTQLKSLLASKKEKLARIDEAVTKAEEQTKQEQKQQRKNYSSTVILVAILAVVLAYIVVRR